MNTLDSESRFIRPSFLGRERMRKDVKEVISFDFSIVRLQLPGFYQTLHDIDDGWLLFGYPRSIVFSFTISIPLVPGHLRIVRPLRIFLLPHALYSVRVISLHDYQRRYVTFVPRIIVRLAISRQHLRRIVDTLAVVFTSHSIPLRFRLVDLEAHSRRRRTIRIIEIVAANFLRVAVDYSIVGLVRRYEVPCLAVSSLVTFSGRNRREAVSSVDGRAWEEIIRDYWSLRSSKSRR
jgi:hypothetical protein